MILWTVQDKNLFQVQDRILKTRKSLDLEMTAEKLMLHADQMSKTMKSYIGSVKACFDHMTVSFDLLYIRKPFQISVTHFKVVAGAAKRDEEKLLLRTLNRTYGLPEGQMEITSKMYPTIPSAHISTCTKTGKYFSEQPLDKQANIVALCYIMVKGYQQQVQRSYTAVVNGGDCHFGDQAFRGLNSYRTL